MDVDQRGPWSRNRCVIVVLSGSSAVRQGLNSFIIGYGTPCCTAPRSFSRCYCAPRSIAPCSFSRCYCAPSCTAYVLSCGVTVPPFVQFVLSYGVTVPPVVQLMFFRAVLLCPQLYSAMFFLSTYSYKFVSLFGRRCSHHLVAVCHLSFVQLNSVLSF
jgi:hypothetical protein